jgi:hypothetical protein
MKGALFVLDSLCDFVSRDDDRGRLSTFMRRAAGKK